MPVKILIPTALRRYTKDSPSVEVAGATVGEVLKNLAAAHPDLRRHLFADDGKVRSFVNVYLNDDDVRYLAKKDASPVAGTDVISIVPSVAGGAGS